MSVNQVKAGAVLNYVLIGVNIFLGLLYTPYMLRMLGQREYGLYSLVASIIAYLTLFDFGMGTAVVRYTAKFRTEGKIDESRSAFGMFFLLYTGVGIIAFIAGLCLCFNVDTLFDRTMTLEELSRAKIMILLLLVNLAVTFPMGIFNSIITAYEEFVFQKVLNILRVVLSTVVIVLLLHKGYKAIAMVVVQTVFNLMVLAMNAFYCRYKLSIHLAFTKFKFTFVREVLTFSFWVFLSDIMSRIYWNIGQFILGGYRGTVAVSVFALAVTLELMYTTFSVGISGVLLPRITSITTMEHTESQVSDLFIRVGRLQYSVLSLLLSGFVLFGRQFVALWAGAGYDQVYVIALIFFFSSLAPLLQNIGGQILIARNQMKYRSALLVCVASASLVLQIILARPYGAIGCAIAVGLALFVGQGILMNLYYRNKQKINIGLFWREIAKISVIPLLLTIGGWFVIRYFELDNILKLSTAIALYTIVYIPLFWHTSMNADERRLFVGLCKRLKHTVKSNKELKGNMFFTDN